MYMKKLIVIILCLICIGVSGVYARSGGGGHSFHSSSHGFGGRSSGRSLFGKSSSRGFGTKNFGHVNASKIGGGARGVRSFSKGGAKAFASGKRSASSRYVGKSFAKAKTISSSKTARHPFHIHYSRPVYFVNPYYHHYYGGSMMRHDTAVVDTNAFHGFGKGTSGGAGASQRNFASQANQAKKDSTDIMDIQPINYLSDFAGVIPFPEQMKINSMIRRYKKQTGVEMAVVILPTLGEEVDIDDYAQLLFDKWGIGEKDINNGVLILITTEDKMLRLQPGYGLEELLTDADSRAIEDANIIPSLKNDKWNDGVLGGVNAIIKKFGTATIEATKQAYADKKAKEEAEREKMVGNVLIFIAIAGLIYLMVAVARKKRNRTIY